MSKRFASKRENGFSLVETLAVVAILVILLGVASVAAAYYKDYLKITELDNAAREIYMAAENRAVLLDGGGQLDAALGVSTLAGGEAAPAQPIHITKQQAAERGLLTFGAIDPALTAEDVDFYIFYDPASGAVTDVFYAEKSIHFMDQTDPTSFLDVWSHKSRDERMRPGDAGPMLGYYGGEQAAREDYTPLPAPEVMVVVHNGDLLTVDVTFSVPESARSLVGSDWIAIDNDPNAERRVTLAYEGRTIDLPLQREGSTSQGRGYRTKTVSGDTSVTYTWVLDQLAPAGGPANTQNCRFRQLFKDQNATYGGDFTVAAEFTLSAEGRRSTTASGSDTGNSLFAEHSGGTSALLENLRHLQNLDAATSAAGGKTGAVQLKDIDCCGKEGREPYGLYEFKPIRNTELLSFDGGWTTEDGKNRRNEITDLRVTEASAGGREGAGLFEKTEDEMQFTGVRLIDAEVTYTEPAGALVGVTGNNTQFKDIQVFNAYVDSGKAAGGVVGSAVQSTQQFTFPSYNTKFQNIRIVNTRVNCNQGAAGGVAGKAHDDYYFYGPPQNYNFDNCQVYWEPEEGQKDLRSLLGSDNPEKEIVDYAINGKNAGGLVGEISAKRDNGYPISSISTSISNCLAATTIHGTQHAGGIAGTSESSIEIFDSYTDCYLSGQNAAGMVGAMLNAIGFWATNAYTAGFIDMSCTEKAAGFALGVSDSHGSLPKLTTENAYTAIYYPGQEEGVDYTSRIFQLSELQSEAQNDSFVNTYYLEVNYGHTNPKDSIGGQADPSEWAKAISYPDLTATSFPGKLNAGAFGKKTEASSFPYDLQEGMRLDIYPFPGLKNLPHYNDWGAEFSKPSLVYYEQYPNSQYRFSGGNVRYLLDDLDGSPSGSLEEERTIKKDGYAVAFLKPDIGGEPVTISYTYLDNSDPENPVLKQASATYSEGDPNFPLLTASGGGKEYCLAPLPDASMGLVDKDVKPVDLVTGSLTNPDFFQYLRFEASYGSGSASAESFYNPHFAETVIPYASEDGSPFLRPDEADGKKAAQLISEHAASELIAKRTHGAVSIRTPRHFFHLSQFPDYYNNERFIFQQERPLDGGGNVYTGYPDLLAHDGRGFQIQAPIGTQAKSFLGIYNGNCQPIQRIAFEIPEGEKNRVCAGLFGCSNGTLENIVYSLDPSGAENPDGTAQTSEPRFISFPSIELKTYLGALAGMNGFNGKIQNCAVAGVNLTTKIFNRTIYIGGLCGENQGVIQNSAAECAYLHADASNFGVSYVGGLAGRNTRQISASYAVGRLAATASEDNVSVRLAGFVGLNEGGSISNSYAAMDLRPDGKNAEVWGFCAQSSGGRPSGTCYYLNSGNFSYRGTSFLAKYKECENSSAQPLTYIQLTDRGTNPVPGMSWKPEAEDRDVFPYPTGVEKLDKTGKTLGPEHYGLWPAPLELGSMGVYYWEEVRHPGAETPDHYVSLLAVDPGDSAAAPKVISRISTLPLDHDRGGEVTRYGYGVYNLQGSAIIIGDEHGSTPLPLLYSVMGGGGEEFTQEKFRTLEEAKKNAADPSSPDYLNRLVDEDLAENMTFKLDEEGTSAFEFHSFHTYDAENGQGGLYPNSTPAQPNGTLTLTQNGRYPDKTPYRMEVTFSLNPLFAGALAVQKPESANWVVKNDDVPTITITQGGGSWTLSGKIPGGADNAYQVRSIDQLQFIDWNRVNRDVDTRVMGFDIDGAAVGANAAEHIGNFPYLSSGGNTGEYCWKQTYDLLGKENRQTVETAYTPIAEYYDTTGTNKGTLTGWFGGSYDGGTYLIKDVFITGQQSSCAGLFGVVYDANLENIVLYSSEGNGFIATKSNQKTDGGTAQTRSRWFSMGGLAGVAGAPEGSSAIKNCSIAGYTILGEVYTYAAGTQDWGGANIGGLVGSSHMSFSGCSAVTDIEVKNSELNDHLRVGGIAGACQGSLKNCYAGGSIEVDPQTVTLKAAGSGKTFGVYVGGLVGGSYMKSLSVGSDSGIFIGAVGTGSVAENKASDETCNTLKNCYSYVTLPPLTGENAHSSLRAVYAVGGTGEIFSKDDNETQAAANHGYTTYENCYFLESKVLENYGGTVDSYLQAVWAAQGETKPGKDPREPKTDVAVRTAGRTIRFTTPSQRTESHGTWNDPFNGKQAPGTSYYYKAASLETGTPLYSRTGNWTKTYTFVGWYNDGGFRSSSEGDAVITIPDQITYEPNVTALTYEQLSGPPANGPADPIYQINGQTIYDLLNAGKDADDPLFKKVTTSEDGAPVPGKYSYSTRLRPDLQGRDYPFPTILTMTKDGGKYNVHYGDWPLKGFERRALDENGEPLLDNGKPVRLGGTPIEIDLFVDGTAPYQEHLVLTEGVSLRDDQLQDGVWSYHWNTQKDNPIAEAAEIRPADTAIEGEDGRTFLLSLTPKRDGTDILVLTYRVGGTPYTLSVTVHVTAGAELRPSRLFMFPTDTVEITPTATDSTGRPLEGGKLTLKGDPSCGSSGYLTAKTQRAEETPAGPPAIRFWTSMDVENPELEGNPVLGANADFDYIIRTPDPDDPDNPDKDTVQKYGGGTGGDIRIQIIQPWKNQEEKLVDPQVVTLDDGTTQVVCTISFPNSYAVGEEGALGFAKGGVLSVSSTGEFPAAAWKDADGKIALTLTYPTVNSLDGLPEETTVRIPLLVTADGGLIDGTQSHTLTVSVKNPEKETAEEEAPEPFVIEAPPAAEDEETRSVRRRRVREEKP